MARVVLRQIMKCPLVISGVPKGMRPAMIMSPIIEYKMNFRLKLKGNEFLDDANHMT